MAYYGIFTFAPVLLGLLERCRRRAGSREAGALALVGGLSLLSGGHQVVLIVVVAGLAYALLLETRGAMVQSSRRRRLLVYFAAVVLAAGLYAPVALPLSQVLQAGVMRGVKFPPELAAANSLDWFTPGLLMNPCFYGPSEKLQQGEGIHAQEHIYALGLFPIALLVCGALWSGPELKARVRFWLAISAVGFFLALGIHNPVYIWLLEHFPGLANFRVPPRFLSFLGLLLMLGGGAGWDVLESRPLPSIFPALGLFAYILFLLTGETGWVAGHVAFLAALAAMLSLTFLPYRVVPLSVGLVAACASWWLYVDSYFVAPVDLQRELSFLAQLKRQLPPHSRLLYALNPESPPMAGLSNALGLTALVSQSTLNLHIAIFHPGTFTSRDLTTWTYENFHPASFLRDVDVTRRLNSGIGGMLCCAAAVTPEKVDFVRARPGFWFSRKSLVMGESEALHFMSQDDFVPERQLIVETEPGSDPPFLLGHPLWKERFQDSAELDLGGQTGWLTISQNLAKGWQADVDGQLRPLLRGYTAFPSLAIHPGDRTLTLRYRPPLQDLARTLGVLCLALTLLLLLSPGRTKRLLGEA